MGCAYEIDTQLPNIWYNSLLSYPYFGSSGINSGVLMMNLTRMRQFNFKLKIYPIYKQYRDRILLIDQDILNIMFYYNPDIVYIFDNAWNYLFLQCRVLRIPSKRVREKGVALLHGADKRFTDRYPRHAFRIVYNSINSVRLRPDVWLRFFNAG
jgi:UDP-xylose:glucoside alpha-1,3-xylosyltransferase